MNDPAVYKITPTESVFSISWNIGLRCNYDCMYCSTDWHDNHSKHLSLQVLQRRWMTLYNNTQHRGLPYKISFTGGEVTANKQFLPLVRWLNENYSKSIAKILATTNGSASLAYYIKLFKYVHNISFSLHSEHVDEKKFFDTIIALQQNLDPDRHLHVIIMDEFWNKSRIPMYEDLLKQHDISYSVNQINYSLGTRQIPIMKGKLNLAIP